MSAIHQVDSRFRGNDSRVHVRRDVLLGLASCCLLSACGFHLRGSQSFAFTSVYLIASDASLLSNELKRSIASGSNTKVLSDPKGAQVVLEVLEDTRQKIVTTTTATGQVREFQLRMRYGFKLRTLQGKELIPDTRLELQRVVAFNESQVLAKEAEEQLLYRSMQSDMVEQVMRRLASVKAL